MTVRSVDFYGENRGGEMMNSNNKNMNNRVRRHINIPQ